MFKLRVLFIVGFFLTLVSCDFPKTPREAFLDALQKEVDAGASYEDITLRIMLRDYPGQEGLFAKTTENYDFGISDEEFERFEQEKIQFVESIKNHECDKIRSYLDKNPPQFEDSNYYLMGFFLEEGMCFERDPEKAAEIYSDFLRKKYNNPIDAARLGNLYWKGDGVEKDAALAEYYFKKAAIWQAPTIWAEKYGEYILDPKDTPEFKIWKLTPGQLSSNFTNIEIGPWDLPEPLIKDIQWIESLVTEDGSKIVEIAKHLFHGSGGYEQDKDTAIAWMSSAGNLFNNHEAEYLSLLWNFDRYQCNLDSRSKALFDCDDWFSTVLKSMESVASKGNDQAILFMINYYIENPNKEWTDWALYQLLLLAQKKNLEIDKNLLDRVKSGLKPFEQKVIDTWVANDFNLSIRNFLPLEIVIPENVK